MRALLDVNFLVAVLEPEHDDHRRARDWMTSEIANGWASCAITQNGFVRVVSQPKYPKPMAMREAIQRLRHATNTEHHRFWPCDLSVLDDHFVDSARLHGPGQLTDAYLLALAAANAGRLVTFDRSVPLTAVPAASSENLVVL